MRPAFLFVRRRCRVEKFKSLGEIADEYERDLAALRGRRDALCEELSHTAKAEHRRMLQGRIAVLERMIYSTSSALYLLRKYGS